MMVLKHFSFPCNLPPSRRRGKERISGEREVFLFRKVLGSNSHVSCLDIGSSIHRSAVAAPSYCRHFTDTAAVQFSRVRIATTNQQQWHDLAETARPQPQSKSVGGTRKNTRRSSASFTVHQVLFISL